MTKFQQTRSVDSSSVLLLLMMLAWASAAVVAYLIFEARVELDPRTLIYIIGIICAVPFIVGLLRRSLDVFEPVYTLAVVAFVYFAMSPWQLYHEPGSMVVYGINYADELSKVLVLSLVSILGFYVGYYAYRKKQDRADHERPPQFDVRTMQYGHLLSYALLFGAIALVILWIITAGIPLRTLWVFGDASYLDWKWESSGESIGYLYGAREAIPACLLLIIATRGDKRVGFWSLIWAIGISLVFAGMGNRSRVLLVVASIFVFYYLQLQKRPRWTVILISLAFVLFFIVGGIGYFRTAQGGDARVVGQDQFTVNDSIDVMYDSTELIRAASIVVKWIPAKTEYQLGRTFLNILSIPIPRFIWPNKFAFAELPGLSSYFWKGAAPPMWSVFYVNFGPVGILIGMALLGVLSKWVYENYMGNKSSIFAMVILALYIPLLMKLIGRGHTTFIVNNAIRVYIPVLIVWVAMRSRQAYLNRKDRVRQSVVAPVAADRGTR